MTDRFLSMVPDTVLAWLLSIGWMPGYVTLFTQDTWSEHPLCQDPVLGTAIAAGEENGQMLLPFVYMTM